MRHAILFLFLVALAWPAEAQRRKTAPRLINKAASEARTVGTECDARRVSVDLVRENGQHWYCDESVTPNVWRLITFGRHRIDVTDFGAVPGDGIADDVQIQAAIDSCPLEGCTIYIPSGGQLEGNDYLLQSSTVIAQSNIFVECDPDARLVIDDESVFALRWRGDQATGGSAQNGGIKNCHIFDPDPVAHSGNACSVTTATACVCHSDCDATGGECSGASTATCWTDADCEGAETCTDPAPAEICVNNDEESHGITVNNWTYFSAENVVFEALGDESADVAMSNHVRFVNPTIINGGAGSGAGGAISFNNSHWGSVIGGSCKDNLNGMCVRIEETCGVSSACTANLCVGGCNDGDACVDINDCQATESGEILVDGLLIETSGDQCGGFSGLGGGGYGIFWIAGQAGGENATFSNNVIEGTRLEPIKIQQTSGLPLERFTISNNILRASGTGSATGGGVVRGAIDLQVLARNGTVSGNTIEGFGTGNGSHVGIHARDYGVNIVGNNISGAAGGISSRADTTGRGNTVRGNTISDIVTTGILGSGDDTISGNSVDCGAVASTKGIQIDGSGAAVHAALLVGNHVFDCEDRGIGIKDDSVAIANVVRGGGFGLVMSGASGTRPRSIFNVFEGVTTETLDSSPDADSDGTKDGLILRPARTHWKGEIPGADHDVDEHFERGSVWIYTTPNPDRIYINAVPTANAAVWLEVTQPLLQRGSSSDPTSGDDINDGYERGSLWVQSASDRIFGLVDHTAGSAIWNELSGPKINRGSSLTPGSGDDIDDGYERGSIWIETDADIVWGCVDHTAGSAIWKNLSTNSGGVHNWTFSRVESGGLDAATMDQQSIAFSSAAITIAEVYCESEGGDVTINLQRDDGTPANILTSDVVCDTNGATGTLSATEKVLTSIHEVDLVIVSCAGGPSPCDATRLSIEISWDFD